MVALRLLLNIPGSAMLVGAKKLAENSEPQLLQWLAAGQSIPDRSHADEHKPLLLGLVDQSGPRQ